MKALVQLKQGPGTYTILNHTFRRGAPETIEDPALIAAVESNGFFSCQKIKPQASAPVTPAARPKVVKPPKAVVVETVEEEELEADEEEQGVIEDDEEPAEDEEEIVPDFDDEEPVLDEEPEEEEPPPPPPQPRAPAKPRSAPKSKR